MTPALRDGRLVVVSPHLDDAVLSCGSLLAQRPGSIVVTVFAGVPCAQGPLTDWDRRCGFHSGRQAMLARRGENARALALLDAESVLLDLLDHQYRDPAQPVDGERVLARTLRALQPTTVLLPLGLFHDDHLWVAEACLAMRGAGLPCAWVAYAEALYRTKPGLMQRRLAALLDRGICATPMFLGGHDGLKTKCVAVRAYASQVEPLGLEAAEGDTGRAELYWALQPGAGAAA